MKPVKLVRWWSVMVGSAGVLVLAGAAIADRPPEALDAEQKEQAIALQYLIRKTDSLSSQLVDRRGHLRKRLRAMYKMSQGGYLRLILGADSPGEMFARRDAADRILKRDVEELQAVREELGELRGLREKLREGEKRAAELAVVARETRAEGLARKDALVRPVDGPILRGFGPYRDPGTGLDFTSDGVQIGTRPGQPVFAPASGAVRSDGELPGLGRALVIDHGDGWLTTLGHLAALEVRVGARVRQGYPIAEAAGNFVELQLSQGGTWLDPASWLLHAPLRPDEQNVATVTPPATQRIGQPVIQQTLQQNGLAGIRLTQKPSQQKSSQQKPSQQPIHRHHAVIKKTALKRSPAIKR